MRIATFIDCENIPAQYGEQVFTTMAGIGNTLSCAGYADFSNMLYRGWQDSFMRNGARAVHVFHNSKDGADGEILIDATECAIKEKKIDAVCIVANDGIYNVLRRVLHRHGKQFFVIGTNLTSHVLALSADTFIQMEGLDPRGTDPEDIITAALEKNGGNMRLCDLTQAVWGLLPNYKAMGYRNMLAYVESLGFRVTVDNSHDLPVHWIGVTE